MVVPVFLKVQVVKTVPPGAVHAQRPTEIGATCGNASRVETVTRTAVSCATDPAIPNRTTISLPNCSQPFSPKPLPFLAWLALLGPCAMALGCGRAAVGPATTLSKTADRLSESPQSPLKAGVPSSAGRAVTMSEKTLPAPNSPPKAVQAAATAWLDSRAVANAVRPHHGAFNTCHRLAASSALNEQGEVTVGWLVQPSGIIEETRVARSTFSNSDVSDCVLSVAMRVKFPASRSPAEVSWTVRFRGSVDGRLARSD